MRIIVWKVIDHHLVIKCEWFVCWFSGGRVLCLTALWFCYYLIITIITTIFVSATTKTKTKQMKIDSSISPSLIRLLSVPLWWWFFGFPVLYKYCSPSWRPYLFVASFITHWIWDLDFFVLNLISCWLFDFIFQKKGKLRFLSRLGNDIQYGLRTEMQIQEFNFFVSSAMYNVDFIKQYDYFAEKKQQTLLSLL